MHTLPYKKTILFLVLALLSVTAGIGQPTVTPKKIIIINSYDNNIRWTSEVIDTVKRHISKYSPQSSIQVENLNMNETPDTLTINNTIAEIIRRNPSPHIAILLGQEAIMEYNANIKERQGWTNTIAIPVNTNNVASTKGQTGAGIGFGTPIKDNLYLITTLIPDLKEILWVDKPYYTVEHSAALFKKELTKKHPNIKFSTIYLSGHNADSVYNVILENKPGRAIITCSWSFIAPQSTYTQSEIDSLFSNTLKTPLFSIYPNYYNNNYMVGGYNLSARVCAEKIVDQTKKIMQGISFSNISFEEVINGDMLLNKSALKRFLLEGYTKSFFEVKYVDQNTVPEENRYELIITITVIIFFILFLIFYYRRSGESIANKTNLTIIKQQLLVMENIFTNADVKYAIYGGSGEKLQENTYGLFPANLFDSPFITKEDISCIKGKKHLNKEIDTNGKILHLIIRSIQVNEEESYKYIATATDVTGHKTDRAEKETLDTLLKDATEITEIGLASYNILTGEGFATDKWYHNMGEQKADNIIQPSYSSCSTEDKAKILDFKKNLSNATAARLGLDIKIHNPLSGKERWIRENIFLHNYDPKNGSIEVIDINFDIHKEKIKEINFVNLNEKAEAANNDSDKFINSISHEIRTPLTSIMGFSNMLATLNNTADKVEIINIIKRNNVMLIELINNILAISKIDSGTYRFDKAKVELNEFFHELKIATAHMVANESLLTDKNLEIICDLPGENHSIITDEWNFRQVMINLLSNAVKFTQEGTIIFGYQPQEEGFYFYVKDTGCGIAAENQDKIFNRFERFDNHSHGTGLGLSLCKSIISHLNGEIGVISREGEGSTFWFILS
ncbi:MAG: HAMP domain-containing sensor histidine kinase [Bacteroidales bacterium]